MGPDKTGTTSIQKFLVKYTNEMIENDDYDPSLSRGTKIKVRKYFTNNIMSCNLTITKLRMNLV